MTRYKQDPVFPEWEPIPWHEVGSQREEQERGFQKRALKPVAWKKVNWTAFPEAGIFGQTKDWFSRHEIAYVATFDAEDLVLIQNAFFGFPDPPEWGLASRPARNAAATWEMWGHFPELPAAWQVPDAV